MYNTDFNKAASQLSFSVARKSRFLAFIRALVSPLGYVRDELNTYILDANKEFSYEFETIMIEKALNDVFDAVERRIYIEDAVSEIARSFAFKKLEKQGNQGYAYKKSEGQGRYGYAFNRTEVLAKTHFIVKVPAVGALIETDEKEKALESFVNRYKLAGKKFVIEEF